MTINASVIGKKSEVHTFEIEKGAIRAFARAVGDDNPLFHDEGYAKRCGYGSLVAPPTFPTTLRIPRLVKFEMSRALHGEQEFIYERPIVAGDILHCVSEVKDVYERQGKSGAMTFIVTEITGVDTEEKGVYKAVSTVILR